MKRTIQFAVLLCCLLFGSQLSEASEYIFNGNPQGGPTYKGVAENYFASWYLKEFDKYAEAPGADWTIGVGKPHMVSNWLGWAVEKGWDCSTMASRPKIGAIIIRVQYLRNDSFLSRLGIVTRIHEDSIEYIRLENISGKSVGEGVVKTFRVTFDELRNPTKDISFKAYIYPEKVKKMD